MNVPYDELVSVIPDGAARVERLVTLYRRRYGDAPSVVSSAPGRTELIGNHTDHNHGRVAAAAVHLDALAVAGPSDGPITALYSSGWDRPFSVDLSVTGLEFSHDTEALMAGVAAGLAERGFQPPGYRAVVDSRVTAGSGLSSSAAFEGALAGIHATLGGFEPSAEDAARAGQYAENVYMNKPSGLMDQTASAVGGVVTMDFADPEKPEILELDFQFRSHGYRLMVVDTGGSHADLTDAYASVPREMRAVAELFSRSVLSDITRETVLNHASMVRERVGDRALLRALHFFAENERVARFVAAARAGNAVEALSAMRASGESSWELLQNVYPPGADREQPIPIGLALSRELLGGTGACRVHGGGFAGTILTVAPEDRADFYRRGMERVFGEGSVRELTIRRYGMISSRLPV